MMFRFLVVCAFVSVASQAGAAECSATLRARWTEAFGEMLDFNRLFSKARNMGETTDEKTLCIASRKVPALIQVAKEYYPACDPISGARDIAEIERLDNLAQRFIKLRCNKPDPQAKKKL